MFCLSSHAQTGAWLPAGANAAYPRTLLQAADIPAVQATLAGSRSAYTLYAGLYAGTGATPPTDNTSSGGRRARATFAKNTAFVLLLNRRPDGAALVPLTEAEQAALLSGAQSALETLNFAVEPFASFAGASYTEWQWRSKELIDYLIAYDLLRGAAVPEAALATAKARLQTFAGNLYQQSNQPFFGVSFYATIKNNHTLMTAAALGMAAVVLNDATSLNTQQQPQNWINAGIYHLDNVLWQDAQRQSDPAVVAGYAEGPYYFKYAFLNCLPFFRAMGHFLPAGTLPYTVGSRTRDIPNPYYDPRYSRLYDWITAILLPDGRLPALEDSYVDMGMPELALTGQRRYVRPLALRNLAPQQLNTLSSQLRDITVDMRAAYLAANLQPLAAPADSGLTVLPASGNLVFRSGPDTLATYLHLYGKNGAAQTNSGGHSQADAGSFLLHAHGQLLALDAGYLSYSRRAEVGNATNHNLVLVDGAGPAIGTTGAANDAAAFVQNTFQTSGLRYGEVQTSYQQASITRKVLFVRGTYFLLADALAAPVPHTYTWQLHGYGLAGGTAGTGTFTDSLTVGAGIWHKNGVQLRAQVVATGGTTYTAATGSHELTYNTPEQHTTLLAHATGTSPQFLAALYPYTSAAPRLLAASTASTATLSSHAAFTDVVFAQADTVLSTVVSALPEMVAADGRLNFYSTDSLGNFAQLFVQDGRLLQYGPQPMLQASRRATLSWQQLSGTQYEGYASRATELVLALHFVPGNVTGAGVRSFTYDASTRQLTLTLIQAGRFFVSAAARPLPVELVRFGAGRQPDGTVRLSWQTASELRNAGFTVERRTAATTFRAVGSRPGRGTTAAPTSYTIDDLTPPIEPTYYRLVQTDHDNATTYSAVVIVPGVVRQPRVLVQPVPASQELTVSFAGAALGQQVQLFNALGQLALQAPYQPQTRLNISHLPPGLYQLRLVDTYGQPLAPTEKILIVR
ncbi:heparinase II/III domain-containing protein [Hymenobacter canadensis]|uniref:Heparinase II/III family protein n=1 Tax=Hymenobacter canadensis TaxID=2999067 RepID=A0ABY7LTU9_9BACT|nr:heparinase II/III family protein [Hymenobacter canadensis]WBA43834.1 heparinase II/III family protein [Hymenobacter canadensis]